MNKLVKLTTALLLLGCLAACKDTSPQKEPAPPPEPTKPNIAQEENIAPANPFEEVVVVDNEYSKITITGVDDTEIEKKYIVNALLENKTTDTSQMFYVNAASIDGVESNPLFTSVITPGKKSNEKIIFDPLPVDTGYTDIWISFQVSEYTDAVDDTLFFQAANIYPKGADNAKKYQYQIKDTDIVLVDNDDISIVVTGCGTHPLGYAMTLYIANKTQYNLVYNTWSASINGYMSNPHFACSVSAGNIAFADAVWLQSELEENGIQDVEEIEFEMTVYDRDDYTKPHFKDNFVVKP